MSCSLLLVDDHDLSRRSLARALELAAHTVYEAESGEAAIDLFSNRQFDVVISDLRLPGQINGLDALRQQNNNSPGIRLILITAFGSAQTQTKAEALGAGYIEKPFSLDVVLATLSFSGHNSPNVQVEFAGVTLKQSEKLFGAFFELAPDSVVVANEAGQIVMINTQTEKLFGYNREELLGKQVEALIPERFIANHRTHRAGFSHNPRVRPMGAAMELYGRRKDGTEFPVEISLSPIGTEEGAFTIAAIRDSTDRKEIEQRLHEHERLATLGTTAAVFAHEIANPLSGLSVCLDVLKTLLMNEMNHEVKETIETARLELNRLTSLLKDYRSFARPQRLNTQLTDLRKLVETVLASQIRRYSASGVSVEMQFEEQLPLIVIDPAKMKQAILNLCQNGLEAMPNGGTLTVRGLPQGDNIVLTVTDSGTGIAPGVDVFQLFRTTKPEGSGLGLAIVQQIVADHKGAVDYVTEVGKGTTFRIVLPLSQHQS